MTKEHSQYHNEYYGSKKKSRKYILAFLFLFVVAIGVFFYFFDGMSITGNAIGGLGSNATVNFNANLNIPEISLKGSYPEINIDFAPGTNLIVDNKKISLNGDQNPISFKDFDGKIKTQSETITLEGVASEIKLPNFPITSSKNKKVKFSIEGVGYNFISIPSEVSIGKLEYLATGQVHFEDSLLQISAENILLKDYKGSFSIENQSMMLKGDADFLEVSGKTRTISLSA